MKNILGCCLKTYGTGCLNFKKKETCLIGKRYYVWQPCATTLATFLFPMQLKDSCLKDLAMKR